MERLGRTVDAGGYVYRTIRSLKERFPDDIVLTNVLIKSYVVSNVDVIAGVMSCWAPHRLRKDTSGYIYALIPISRFNGQRVVKIGKTVSWAKRSKYYSGMNSMEEIILVKKVADRHTCEKIVLDVFYGKMQPAIGREWFYFKDEYRSLIRREFAKFVSSD